MASNSPRADDSPREEGLRERKKRQTRKLISRTATQMFLDQGFDEVKIIDIARQCDVSEKTIYNYFPTKESLLLDREEKMADLIRQALGPAAPSRSPVEAARAVLARDLDEITHYLPAGRAGIAALRRFAELLDSTATLRAAQLDMEGRLVQVAAEAMATSAGVNPTDPEPQIAAYAIIGLWRIQYQALRRYTAEDVDSADELQPRIAADIERAAQLIDSGLWAFSALLTGDADRDRMKAAGEAAQRSSRRVVTALRQARTRWRNNQRDPAAPPQSRRRG
jgi:AcrR family transcriptional regulator